MPALLQAVQLCRSLDSHWFATRFSRALLIPPLRILCATIADRVTSPPRSVASLRSQLSLPERARAALTRPHSAHTTDRDRIQTSMRHEIKGRTQRAEQTMQLADSAAAAASDSAQTRGREPPSVRLQCRRSQPLLFAFQPSSSPLCNSCSLRPPTFAVARSSFPRHGCPPALSRSASLTLCR